MRELIKELESEGLSTFRLAHVILLVDIVSRDRGMVSRLLHNRGFEEIYDILARGLPLLTNRRNSVKALTRFRCQAILCKDVM